MRRLTDSDYEAALRQMRVWGQSTKKCPVCGTDPDDYQTFPEDGLPADHSCVDELTLLRQRAAAGISPRQWSFDWQNADTTPVTEAVNDYLADFDNQEAAGQGLVFLAPNYGSGKTTALVQIVKHGLLNGYSGLDARIVRFDDIVSAYKRDDADDADDYQYALQCARILAVDEVVAPVSE